MNFTNIPGNLFNKFKIELFNIDDIYLIVNTYIEQFKLNEYCKEFKIYKRRKNILAIYQGANLRIYYEEIIMHCKRESKTHNLPFVLLVNTFILVCIIHELVHALQEKYFIDGIKLYRIHNEVLKFIDQKSGEKYEKYYYYLIYEREAETIAYENILILIRRYFHNEEIFNYYLDLLEQVLNTGYKFKRDTFYSPIEITYKDIIKKTPPTVNGLNTYNRITFGLPISFSKYQNFYENSKKIILKNNNL